MNFLSIFFIFLHASATIPLSDTIVSIKSVSSKWINISDLPLMMASAGFEVDEKIISFIETADIVHLGNVEFQILKTSSLTVDSDALCDFVNEVGNKLSLESICVKDMAGTIAWKRPPPLNVNDPDARYQYHFRRLQMEEVWRLSGPYVRRKVKVALIDTGIDWEDEDLSPLKDSFETKSGWTFEGGWSYVSRSPNMSVPNRHGTYVARVFAAKGNNSYGMAGIAPNVSLFALQTSVDYEVVRLTAFTTAIDAAIDLQVDIALCSTGFNLTGHDGALRLMFSALRKASNAGIIVTSPAHNQDVRNDGDYPCWFGGPLNICTTSLANRWRDNVLALHAGWGERVDLATYGQYIVVGRDHPRNIVFEYGTSFANPIVAGIAAILLSMGIEPNWLSQYWSRLSCFILRIRSPQGHQIVSTILLEEEP